MAGQRFSQLDGLRGAAILCVLWHHFGLHLPGWLDIGPVAPSIFFLLSGYLITRSLLGRKQEPGQMFSYHARRLTRLLPALYLMLGLGWLIGLEEFQQDLPWHAGLLSNIFMAFSNDWAGGLSHLWSLAVQEQFYLLWPLVLLLPARFLPGILIGLYVGAAIFRAACLQTGAPDLVRWLMLPASLDAFAAGGLIAWAMAGKDGPLIPAKWRLPAAAIALTCWIISRQLRYLEGTGSLALAFVEFFETATLAYLLILLLQNGRNVIVRVFSSAWLVFLGQISYGLYIWHVMVHHALGPHLSRWGLSDEEHNVVRCAILTLASIGVAALSWIAVEKPFIAWGRQWNGPEGLFATWKARLARILAGAQKA